MLSEFATKADRKQTHDDDVYAHGHWLAGVGAHSVCWTSRGSRLAHAPDVYCRSWWLLCFFDLFLSKRRTWASLSHLEGDRTNCGFLASMIFLNEPVSVLQLFAFFLIAGGILSLSLRSFGYFQKQPSTIFYALGTGILDWYLQCDRRNWGKKFWECTWLYLLAFLPGNVDGASLRLLSLQGRHNSPLVPAWMERCLGWFAGSLCLRICALGHGIGSHHAGCCTSRNECGDGLSAWHPDPKRKQRPSKSSGCRAGHTGNCSPQSLEPKRNLAGCRKIFGANSKISGEVEPCS